MSEDNYQVDIGFGRVALLLWLGSRLTVFYQREFKLTQHVRPVSDLGSLGLAICGLYLEARKFAPPFGTMCCLWQVFELFLRVDSGEEMLKSLLLAGSFQLAISGSVAFQSWIAVCIMGTTQLLRWPLALKTYLRNLRTVCGPSYAILIAGACLKESFLDEVVRNETSSMSLRRSPSLLEWSAVAATLASVFFRPDNQDFWSMLPCAEELSKRGMIPDSKRRKHIHATLMILSYICMVAKFFVLDFDLPWRVAGCFLIALSCAGLVMGVNSISSLLKISQNQNNELLGV